MYRYVRIFQMSNSTMSVKQLSTPRYIYLHKYKLSRYYRYLVWIYSLQECYILPIGQICTIVFNLIIFYDLVGLSVGKFFLSTFFDC